MTKPRAIPHVSTDEVFVIFGLIFVGFHFCGILARPLLGEYASTPMQWLWVAALPIIHLRRRRMPLAETLHLQLPAPKHWLGAVILVAGVTGAGNLYMLLQNAVFSVSDSYVTRVTEWNERLSSATGAELAVLMFTVAITPAICEEILFRGYLTRMLQSSFRPATLCVQVGVLFGLFHVDPVQLIPAALIGMAFTWVALVTGSLWPPILMHLIFNSVTIFAHHFGPSPEVSLASQIALAIVCLPLGVYLLRPARGAKSNGPSHAAAPSSEPVTGVNP